MAMHKVTVATWEVFNDAGQRRRVFFGDVVDLTEAEAARGVAVAAVEEIAPVEVVVEPAPIEPITATEPAAGEAAVKPAAGEPVTTEPAPTDTSVDGSEKPKKTAKVDVWREYVVAQGVATADEAEKLSKDELIELVG